MSGVVTPISQLGQVIPPSLHPYASQLADFAVRAQAAADHWMALGQEDRAIQCHQMAALYFQASIQAEAQSL